MDISAMPHPVSTTSPQLNHMGGSVAKQRAALAFQQFNNNCQRQSVGRGRGVDAGDTWLMPMAISAASESAVGDSR